MMSSNRVVVTGAQQLKTDILLHVTNTKGRINSLNTSYIS